MVYPGPLNANLEQATWGEAGNVRFKMSSKCFLDNGTSLPKPGHLNVEGGGRGVGSPRPWRMRIGSHGISTSRHLKKAGLSSHGELVSSNFCMPTVATLFFTSHFLTFSQFWLSRRKLKILSRASEALLGRLQSIYMASPFNITSQLPSCPPDRLESPEHPSVSGFWALAPSAWNTHLLNLPAQQNFIHSSRSFWYVTSSSKKTSRTILPILVHEDSLL